MKVCELFTSIQGESTYSGLPCTFIRLTGCNLRCSYCDTGYAFEEGRDMPVEEIIAYVRSANISLVEVTGGEPLLQGSETLRLISELLDASYTVLVETNGSLSIRDVDKRAVIILDLKTPGSGMDSFNDFSNIGHLKTLDEVKIVISSRADYEWSREVVSRYALGSKCKVLFSPALGKIQPRDLVQWILEDRLPVRLNLQIHKFIFNNEERGV